MPVDIFIMAFGPSGYTGKLVCLPLWKGEYMSGFL